LADFAATETAPTPHLACVRLCKTLAEYRRRQFGSANEWANRAISSEGITARQKAAAFLIQSCTLVHLGQIEMARTAFDKGVELLQQSEKILLAGQLSHPPMFSRVFGDTWCDWTIAEMLRAEAAEVLGISQPATSTGAVTQP
jgi:hypothetical protein